MSKHEVIIYWSAACLVAPSAAQPGSSGTSARNALSSALVAWFSLGTVSHWFQAGNEATPRPRCYVVAG